MLVRGTAAMLNISVNSVQILRKKPPKAGPLVSQECFQPSDHLRRLVHHFAD
jgi:hypothetical protein